MPDPISISASIAAIAMAVAEFVKESRARAERAEDQSVQHFLEWLRRNNHAALVTELQSHSTELDAIAQAIEWTQQSATIDADTIRQQLEQTLAKLQGSEWLSKESPSLRANRRVPLVGRDSALSWLESRGGDGVVVGQPGSGKTYLLERFLEGRNAFFALPTGLGTLANHMRSVAPDIVVVDDAGDKKDTVTQLVHLRDRSATARFRIVATCWPSERDRVSHWLKLPPSSAHELQSLTRDDIVQIVKAVGIDGPNALIALIVNQSRNKPGLAVTLSEIALNGGGIDVWDGSVLSSTIREWFEPRLGKQVTAILAAFAIGDERGMRRDDVAKSLELPAAKLASTLKELAFGGVLEERSDRRLSVQPAELRFALMKHQYFDGLACDDAEPLFAKAEPRSVAASLIGVKRIGGNITDKRLLLALEHVQPSTSQFALSGDLWAAYAALGPYEAEQVLDRFPEYLRSNPQAFLHHMPKVALPKILDWASNDDAWRTNASSSTLRILERWIEEAPARENEPIQRRELLAVAALDWLRSHTPNDFGIAALRTAFNPATRHAETDPGAGRTVTFYMGCLGVKSLRDLGTLWDKSALGLQSIAVSYWAPLLQMIREWVHPGMHLRRRPSSPAEQNAYDILLQAFRAVCKRMVADVAVLANGHAGVHHELSQLPVEVVDSTTVVTDQVFELLYSEFDVEDGHEKRHATHRELVQQLAAAWAKAAPLEVATRISNYERLAREAGVQEECWIPTLSAEIARRCESIADWVQTLLKQNASANTVWWFLEVATKRDAALGEDLILRSLSNPTATWGGVQAALDYPTPSDRLLNELEGVIADDANSFAVRYMMRESPIVTVRYLLDSDHVKVAKEAAIGEWLRNKRGGPRAELRERWERVVVESVDDDHIVSRILSAEPAVGFLWVRKRIADADMPWYQYDQTLAALRTSLTQQQRIELANDLPAERGYRYDQFLAAVVGSDPRVFTALLESRPSEDRVQVALATLSGESPTEPGWIALATAAIGAGASPEAIAASVLHPAGMAFGDGVEFWSGRVEMFKTFTAHSDAQIQSVGHHGIKLANEQIERVKKEQHEESLHGIR